ncbi:MAG: archaemetzincin family Zn-dependent metalloprotease [Vulcanimicrobiota bacterium]
MKLQRIGIIPIGNLYLQNRVLDELKKNLSKSYNCEVEIITEIDVIRRLHNAQRQQYLASGFFEYLRAIDPEGHCDLYLGVINEDLYVPGLNFVFGLANPENRSAIIGLARLNQEFYNLSSNDTLFLERTVKEAIHEIGHLIKLKHCEDPLCVMHFSNSLPDTDRKTHGFCEEHKKAINSMKKVEV